MKPTIISKLLPALLICLLSAWSVFAQPVANFSANITSGCAPLRVEFDNNSTGSIEWDWDFGDGSPLSFAENPVHYYTQPGTYTVTLIAYGSGASDTETKVNYITVTGFGIEVDVTDATCGQANGSIDVTVNSNAPPVTYSWTNGATTQDLTNLAAGSYRVTVSDGSGCVFTETYHVETSAGFTITGDVEPVVPGVHLGAINLTISGGTGPFSYAWSNGETGEIIDGLAAGTYCVTVTDANGCVKDKCFLIETAQGCNLSISGSVHDASSSTADNGYIEPFVTGGTPPYSYSWSNGETSRIIDGLTIGTYCVTVTDANGCSADNCFVVEVTPANCSTLTITGAITDVSVPGENDGAIVLTISGGTSPYTYSWSNGATTKNIDNLTNGQYCVIVTDVNGCTKDKCFMVEVANACGNFSVVQQITNATCGAANGSINLIVSGGTQPYFFVWSNGSNDEDIYNLVAGNYRITVEDNGGCRFTETFTVGSNTNNLSITGTVTNLSAPGAQNGEINVTVSGGTPPYTYYWTHGATTEDLSALEAGQYCLLVTDANGCSADNCFNVETNGGCGDFTVTGNVGHVPCGGATGYINITVQFGTPPYFYNWSNGATTEDLFSIAPGTYTVTIEDSGPCRIVHTFTVGYSGGFQISGIVTPATAGTATGSIVLSLSGGTTPYTFDWSNGASTQNIDNLPPGQYCVLVTDANGCIEDKCFTVGTAGGCGDFYVTAHDDIYLCEPGTVWLEANAYFGEEAYSYSWSPVNGLSNPSDRITQATVTDTTTFTITVVDDNGCTVTDEVTVFVGSGTSGSTGVTFNSITICAGDSVQLAAFGGTSYGWTPSVWMSSSMIATPVVYPEISVDYVVAVENAGCTSTHTVHVEVDEDCVWPGDANHDGIANNFDVLALGIGNGISGFPRPNATNNWDGQYCPDWFLALASGPNLKHVDCDGNGVIDAADTIPLFLNYGLTHNRSSAPGQKFVDPELFFLLPTDTALAGQEIEVPVYLGNSNLQVSNFYGIAFSVNYDNTIVEENTMHFAPVNSFMGSAGDLLSFDYDLYGESKLDAALTRIDRTTASGFGQIGTLSFAMKDDISGKDFLVRELALSFSDVRAIDNNENDVQFFYDGGSLFVKQETSGIWEMGSGELEIAVYPNPAHDVVTVETKDKSRIQEIQLFDGVGKEILYRQTSGNKISLTLSNLAPGSYLVKVKSDNTEAIRKIFVH